jgi:hypothetical protein
MHVLVQIQAMVSNSSDINELIKKVSSSMLSYCMPAAHGCKWGMQAFALVGFDRVDAQLSGHYLVCCEGTFL